MPDLARFIVKLTVTHDGRQRIGTGGLYSSSSLAVLYPALSHSLHPYKVVIVTALHVLRELQPPSSHEYERHPDGVPIIDYPGLLCLHNSSGTRGPVVLLAWSDRHDWAILAPRFDISAPSCLTATKWTSDFQGKKWQSMGYPVGRPSDYTLSGEIEAKCGEDPEGRGAHRVQLTCTQIKDLASEQERVMEGEAHRLITGMSGAPICVEAGQHKYSVGIFVAIPAGLTGGAAYACPFIPTSSAAHHDQDPALIATLQSILGRDDGARALAAILARRGYLEVSPARPVSEGVAEALVRAGRTASSLRDVFAKLSFAVAQLTTESPQYFIAGLEVACEVVAHLAPAGSQDLATAPSDGAADFEVATAKPASLDIIAAREGGHPSFLELRSGELVGRGRIAEPAFGPELRRDTDSTAREFVRHVAREIGLKLDVTYPKGIEQAVDQQLARFTARTPEGTPGLLFCPRYVDVVGTTRDVLTKEVRERVRNLLPRLTVITRDPKWSDLDEALEEVAPLYQDREKR